MLSFVPIIRTTFDVPLAESRSDMLQRILHTAGFPVHSHVPLTTLEEAQVAALKIQAASPTLLVIFQATFADSTMVQALAAQVDAPILLWAVPEAHTGERLRLNSLCGVNLAAHALTKAGIPYHYIYAAPDDPAAIPQLARYYRAAMARQSLRKKRIGRVGVAPDGFETCNYDAAQLEERFGLEVLELDLETSVFPAMREIAAHKVDEAYQQLSTRVAGLQLAVQFESGAVVDRHEVLLVACPARGSR